MTVHHVLDLAHDHLVKARAASSARSATTLTRQGPLRQTLIALAAGAALHEHAAPRAATLHLVSGAARLTAGDEATELAAGDLTDIPQQRHSLEAVDDTVMVLTVLAD